jgi:hypothetical protein
MLVSLGKSDPEQDFPLLTRAPLTELHWEILHPGVWLKSGAGKSRQGTATKCYKTVASRQHPWLDCNHFK